MLVARKSPVSRVRALIVHNSQRSVLGYIADRCDLSCQPSPGLSHPDEHGLVARSFCGLRQAKAFERVLPIIIASAHRDTRCAQARESDSTPLILG